MCVCSAKTSAKTGEGVEHAFTDLVGHMWKNYQDNERRGQVDLDQSGGGDGALRPLL